MTEEKEFNEQDNIEEFSINNVEQNGVEAIENQSISEDVKPVESVSNTFLYASSPVVTPVVEEPIQETVQNAFVYNEESAPVMNEVQTLENVETNAPQEEVVNVVESKPVEQKKVQADNDSMDKDLKNNLVFIVVFALLMFAIIVALPYISGYN